jgi:hypothetical protein
MIVMFGGMIALVGCDPRPFFYFLQPFEPTIPPPGPDLKGKKVVVLTHCTAGTQAEFPGLERDLNREFVANLKKKVKKITVVDPDKVVTWAKGIPWTEPADARLRGRRQSFSRWNNSRPTPRGLNVLQGAPKCTSRL